MRFRQFIENAGIQAAIQTLLAKVQQLPDTDNDQDLFGEKNKKKIMLPYYQHLLQNMDDPGLIEKLAAVPLDGDPLQVYNTIDGAGHPVRDYLIARHIEGHRLT